MHERSPLSTDQIEQLKIELTKIQETNFSTFPEKYCKNLRLCDQQHFDTLYQFSVIQHERLSRELQRVLRFAFTILNNFQALWEQVYFRDTKLTELRQTFGSATAYIQELKEENYELKRKMAEAETYIEWIQEQKECLDAIYEDRLSSTTAPSSNNIRLSRCGSESSIRWNGSRVKDNITFQKLKDYIDRLREERNQYERQLVDLNRRFEMKCQESKKASLVIQHLCSRLNKTRCLRSFRDVMDFEANSAQSSSKNAFLTDDFLQSLEKDEPCSSTSLKNHMEIESQDLENRYDFTNDWQSSPKTSLRELSQSQSYYSGVKHKKQAKEVEMCTQSQLLRCQTTQTQTQEVQNKIKQKKIDYKISIHITGQDNQELKIGNILKDLQIQKKIETGLKSNLSKPAKQKLSEKKEAKVQSKNSRIGQFLDYYHQRWVSNRIKKYSFQKPDTTPIYKCCKK